MLDGRAGDFLGPPAASVAELEATPEFREYTSQLLAYMTTGASSDGLGAATQALAAWCRQGAVSPETILKTLHWAGFGTDLSEGYTNHTQSVSYLRALRQLLSAYFDER